MEAKTHFSILGTLSTDYNRIEVNHLYAFLAHMMQFFQCSA